MNALDALESYQTQLDADGVTVGVSRQALDEVLTRFKALQDFTKSIDEAGIDWGQVVSGD